MSTNLQFRIQLPEASPDNASFRFAPILMALECLTKINQWHFRRGAASPIFESSIRYKEEPPGREDWDDCITVAERGWGDCEDLAAYLAAELRETKGIPAECVIKYKFIPASQLRSSGFSTRAKSGLYLVHVMVRLPDGTIIDPSKLLGMKGEYH